MEEQNSRHYAFYQNTQCEYFPCHKTAHPEDFNCLFCYCPLYALGRRCGGNFRYLEGQRALFRAGRADAGIIFVPAMQAIAGVIF